MTNEKLKYLQQFIQSAADTAWEHKMSCSIYETMPTSFGTHLETILSSRSEELSMLLDDIALDEAKKENQSPKPINFNKYIRYNSQFLDHKEVFVGDKWVIVPNSANVDFRSTSSNNNFSFSVSIKHGSDYANFTSTESLQSFQNHAMSQQSEKLNVEQQGDYVSKEEFDWMRLGGLVYNKTKSNVGALGDFTELYNNVPKDFKRTYAYKIHKVTKALKKPAKAGKIFQGAEKFATKAGKVAKIGPYLSAGTIAYEIGTDSWDAHTAVDGALLVVGIVATSFGAPVVLVGIAIYGILDYAFNISESIDENFGRKSGFWDKKNIYSFPKDNKPLFNKIEIDNTYVAPKFRIPPKFKN